MTSISYSKAGASCLPIVGPFVAMLNVMEVDVGLQPVEIAIIKVARALGVMMDELEASWNGDQKGLREAQQKGTISKSTILQSIHQKGRLYDTCGIAGNLLSIATVACAIALSILNTPLYKAIAFGSLVVFAFEAVFLGYRLHQHNKALENLSKRPCCINQT